MSFTAEVERIVLNDCDFKQAFADFALLLDLCEWLLSANPLAVKVGSSQLISSGASSRIRSNRAGLDGLVQDDLQIAQANCVGEPALISPDRGLSGSLGCI